MDDDCMNRCSFISLYQEKVPQVKSDGMPSSQSLGTQTRTDSREQSDQDSFLLGTTTFTQTRETPDVDDSYTQFSILPHN
jgi:hypothetical protein